MDGVTSPSQKKEDKGQEKGEGGTPPSQRKDSNEMPRPRKDERVRQREVDFWARKGPIRCYYKGKHRIIHDGGGLTSPGRLPVEEREEALGEEGTMVASEVRQMFLEWIQSKSEGKEDGVKECFWKLAGGKLLWGLNGALQGEAGCSPGTDGFGTQEEVGRQRLGGKLQAT